jgi:hypothetical protein
VQQLAVNKSFRGHDVGLAEKHGCLAKIPPGTDQLDHFFVTALRLKRQFDLSEYHNINSTAEFPAPVEDGVSRRIDLSNTARKPVNCGPAQFLEQRQIAQKILYAKARLCHDFRAFLFIDLG